MILKTCLLLVAIFSESSEYVLCEHGPSVMCCVMYRKTLVFAQQLTLDLTFYALNCHC